MPSLYLSNKSNFALFIKATEAIKGSLTSACVAFATLLSFSVFSVAAVDNSSAKADIKQVFAAKKALSPIQIDGDLDPQWQKANWYPLDKPILGGTPTKSDFNGQFKLMWDQDYLYLVAEFEDDVLIDKIADPLHFYWDDDTLEIFIDEDASGGEHQFSYNAFAYHVALDNQAIDIGEKDDSGKVPFIALNDHVQSRWKRHQNGKVVWEVAISVYGDNFKPNAGISPVKLHLGKVMGFMLAYCDNDGSKQREHFIGSTDIQPIDGDKNLGYRLADVFSKLTLID